MNERPVKMLLMAPEFFRTEPRKIITEECPVAGRVYFLAKLKRGDEPKLVAVGELEGAA